MIVRKKNLTTVENNTVYKDCIFNVEDELYSIEECEFYNCSFRSPLVCEKIKYSYFENTNCVDLTFTLVANSTFENCVMNAHPTGYTYVENGMYRKNNDRYTFFNVGGTLIREVCLLGSDLTQEELPHFEVDKIGLVTTNLYSDISGLQSFLNKKLLRIPYTSEYQKIKDHVGTYEIWETMLGFPRSNSETGLEYRFPLGELHIRPVYMFILPSICEEFKE